MTTKLYKLEEITRKLQLKKKRSDVQFLNIGDVLTFHCGAHSSHNKLEW